MHFLRESDDTLLYINTNLMVKTIQPVNNSIQSVFDGISFVRNHFRDSSWHEVNQCFIPFWGHLSAPNMPDVSFDWSRLTFGLVL